MDAWTAFRIPPGTLKADQASFHWDLDHAFLAGMDDQNTVQGKFQVDLELERSAGVVTLIFRIQGAVETTCDRCNASISMPVEGEYHLLVKAGDPQDSDDEVLYVVAETPNLNVAAPVYDYIMLSVPIRKQIEGCENLDPKPCDDTILAYLSKHETDIIPERNLNISWDDLKKAIDN